LVGGARRISESASELLNQREGARIGGDVIVLGGIYHHGKAAPDRDPKSVTIMYAGYEDQLRGSCAILQRSASTVISGLLWHASVGDLNLVCSGPGVDGRHAEYHQPR